MRLARSKSGDLNDRTTGCTYIKSTRTDGRIRIIIRIIRTSCYTIIIIVIVAMS